MPDRYQTSVHNSAPDVVLAYSAYGDPVVSTDRSSAVGEHIQPALWSVFEDYKSPKHGTKRCKVDDCNAWGTEATGYEFCIAHARSEGLIDYPSGRKPKSESE